MVVSPCCAQIFSSECPHCLLLHPHASLWSKFSYFGLGSSSYRWCMLVSHPTWHEIQAKCDSRQIWLRRDGRWVCRCACIRAEVERSPWRNPPGPHKDLQPSSVHLSIVFQSPRYAVILGISAAVEFIPIRNCCDHDLEKQFSVLLHRCEVRNPLSTFAHMESHI